MNARLTIQFLLFVIFSSATLFSCSQSATPPLKTTFLDSPRQEKIQNAKIDLLGEPALKLSGGPSYEYFRDLLPPLRYVDANFKYYPITLCAPFSTCKARFV